MKTRSSGRTRAVEERVNGAGAQASQLKLAGAAHMPDTRAASLVQLQLQERAGMSGQVAQLMACGAMMAGGELAASVQRIEDADLLQGKFETVQRVEEEDLLQGKFEALQGRAEATPLQGRFESAAACAEANVQRQERQNNTGLPDQLKSGIESMSGMSMDHVKVHFNSARPAQLQAHAFAQGSEIHLAPGQEKHLPHEAWHVVQQAQGRVKPTMQMHGGVPVNDDVGLESEADVMGAKAAALAGDRGAGALDQAAMAGANDAIVQRYTVEHGLSISNNARFAVRGGPGDSALYVAEGVVLPRLQHVTFTPATDRVDFRGQVLHRYVAEFEDEAEMEKLHCGRYSVMTTGFQERVENDDAPVYRSLYVDNPSGIFESPWKNHYAPVILTDGTDRGTLETAVAIDHIWFGIYGVERGHTFRYKTAVASARLMMEENPGEHEHLYRLLTDYETHGDASLEGVDETTAAEIRKISGAIETHWIEDGQTPATTELTRAGKIREAEEKKSRSATHPVIGAIRAGSTGWESMVRDEVAVTFRPMVTAAIEQGGSEEQLRRLNEAAAMMPTYGGSSSSMFAKQAPSDISSWRNIGGIAVLMLVLALFARMLR